MESSQMSYKEETLRLRSENKVLRQVNGRLKNQNKKLQIRVALLEKENVELRDENSHLKESQLVLTEKQAHLEKDMESLGLIVEELRGMVFKKKSTAEKTPPSPESDSGVGSSDGKVKSRKSANREKKSYRRPIPSEVDEVIIHPLEKCEECGTLLTRLKEIVQYIEDIIHIEELSEKMRHTEKHIVTSGYCSTCKKRKVTIPITPQSCVLGENIKKYIAYLITIMRLSFEQVRDFLRDTTGIYVSDGDISMSLDSQATLLQSEEERIKQSVRGAPGRHFDETTWRVQSRGEGNYGWITTPTVGEEAVFLMGKSRGQGNAIALRGDLDNQVAITDDYVGYRNIFKKQQLCMAHPHRKLRDLHESNGLSEQARSACTQTFTVFAQLYHDLKETLATSYDKDRWLSLRDAYIQRLKGIGVPTPDDPKKLCNIKEGFIRNAQKYFTCLLEPGIPADNNKAERKLRHIVLKRRISQGSKTPKGADIMATLFTTMLSKWWTISKQVQGALAVQGAQSNFFHEYNLILK